MKLKSVKIRVLVEPASPSVPPGTLNITVNEEKDDLYDMLQHPQAGEEFGHQIVLNIKAIIAAMEAQADTPKTKRNGRGHHA